MRINGVEAAGSPPAFALDLPHGTDPYRLIWQQGFEMVRLLSATGSAPQITITVQVRPHFRDRELPAIHVRSVDADLDLTNGPKPLRRQRIAAYGIVLSERGLLATQFSDRTAVAGLWGLPGGGIDQAESPDHAVLREIVEESSQRAELLRLVDMHTDHWIGRSPTGIVEDFHAVRIIYAAQCLEPSDPVVRDVGGTTSDATWIDVDSWTQYPWSAWARAVLERHLAPQPTMG